jgi:hypothetical protein
MLVVPLAPSVVEPLPFLPVTCTRRLLLRRWDIREPEVKPSREERAAFLWERSAGRHDGERDLLGEAPHLRGSQTVPGEKGLVTRHPPRDELLPTSDAPAGN